MEERGLGVGVVLGGGWLAGGGALTCTILVLPPEIVRVTASSSSLAYFDAGLDITSTQQVPDISRLIRRRRQLQHVSWRRWLLLHLEYIHTHGVATMFG
ncbi:hypothetical protein E2C01_017993 [Portunus trituberculatus]|uniref:Uncharacterized protein n=1 Tax=Portunus trituberculatus TaxID=210409 RepID=A0A5B7DV16_PORTR|nr:hypothetical protein [Portunus trituberculatus]